MMHDNKNESWLPAEWPAPAHVMAGTTTRLGGYSMPPFDGFNLALHVGDDPEAVHKNRDHLKTFLDLPSEPLWLEQSHSDRVINADTPVNSVTADAVYTSRADFVCTVMTADCIPVLICNKTGTEIAAIHAGWRGLCARIINKTLDYFTTRPDDLIAWLGPHISSDHYEVGDDVRNACLNSQPESITGVFKKNRNGRWQADLCLLAGIQLADAGLTQIYTSNMCTYQNRESLFSFRRENKTGRVASLIWIDNSRFS